jgi:RNA-directed DNA polymerase
MVEMSKSAVEAIDALPSNLMEKICELDNLRRAYKRVVSNGGAAGIDKMVVKELHTWASANISELRSQLLEGNYQPTLIRGVNIPKPQGGVRCLGIPTVIDRWVQKAILQILEPMYDPNFSVASFGFRPKRSAHQAINQAQAYVKEGYVYTVDIDLEKYFDRVNHDLLMGRLARRIGDKRLLKLIRRFLTAGMMMEGVVSKREAGTPQGSPLSPLLSNIVLDELDKELERRGHKFVRYADDCNIYVKSQHSAERVLQSITDWLWNKLKLRVNPTKSAADRASNRRFLGYRIARNSSLIAPESLNRLKLKLRNLTRRRSPLPMTERIAKLNALIIGWVQYFRLAPCRHFLVNLDTWLRRRLRCVKLYELKRAFARAKFLISQGVAEWQAWLLATSGKGLWRLSCSPQVNAAMGMKWFADLGLVSLEQRYLKVKGV